MPDTAYFTLADDVGLDPDGNPEPLVEIGVTIAVPNMVAGEIVDRAERVTLKPIAGTRIVKIDDQLIASALRNVPSLVETDPPKQRDLAVSRDAVADAREHAGTHTDPQED